MLEEFSTLLYPEQRLLLLRHPESVPLLQANVSVFRNRVEPGYIDSAVVGLQWPLGRLVRHPFHSDHLVIGLSGPKCDDVISHAETSSALAQEVDHSDIRENQFFLVVETVPGTQRVCCRSDA